MGCGSSSLKGEATPGTGTADDAAPRPVKKVATNFSTVDYDTTGKQRRNTEYAPHETERQPSMTADAVAHATNGVEDNGPKQAGEELKPYRTIEDDDPLDPDDPNYGRTPVTNGVSSRSELDPTTQAAKDQFAAENDPANRSNGLNGEGVEEGQSKSNKSWLGKKYSQYDDAKTGRNSQISAEDMQKYTGKNRDEMGQLMEEGEGVGGRQKSSMRDTPGPGTGYSRIVGYSAGGGAA